MCDILIATPESTKDGDTIFAKNSDRPPNEAQIIDIIKDREPRGLEASMTHIDFPEIGPLNDIIISRPWWMWGAEMGVNEHGLAVGNTAVFTKERYEKSGLTGMDLVRIILERCENVRMATGLLTSILENRGQGGSCVYEDELYYHNSFILADDDEAWVIESAGQEWTAEKINGMYSISNSLTIEGDGRIHSPALVSHAMDEGWTKKTEKFDFKSDYSAGSLQEKYARGKERREYTMERLKEKEGELILKDIIEILKSHREDQFKPSKGSNRDICMHYGGFIRRNQTTSSQVSILGDDIKNWFTGTSLPCLSLFKPIGFHSSIPDEGETTNTYDPRSYWWRNEKFNRRFQSDYSEHHERYKKELKELQSKLIDKVREGGNISDLSKKAFGSEKQLKERWDKKLDVGRIGLMQNIWWWKKNREAGLKIS